MIPEEGADRCYICLAGEGEAPVFSNVGDKGELISPCYCSLKAHKTCLVDWVMESGTNSLQEHQIHTPGSNGAWVSSVNSVIGTGVGLNSSRRLFSSDQVKCAQCGHRITLMMKPSSLLNLNSLIRSVGTKVGRNALLVSISGIVGTSVWLALFSSMASVGLKLFKQIAPDSVLLRLLDVPGYSRSFDYALEDNRVNVRHMSILAGFPVYLYATRVENLVSTIYTMLYPLAFVNIKDKLTDIRGPKSFLVIYEALRVAYAMFFSLTFNRLYYRWVHKIRPFYSGGVSEEDYNLIQMEKETLNKLAIERMNKKKAAPKKSSFFTRIYDWFFPNYSQAELQILERQRSRELKLVLLNDYSEALVKNLMGCKLITTSIWPFLGNVVGSILIKSTLLKKLVNGIISTPDEATFAFNAIGCCLVVVMKDLVNLIVAYRKVQQFQNIEILHSEVEGFYELHVQEMIDKQIAESQAHDDEEDEEEDVQFGRFDEMVLRLAAVVLNANR